MEESSLQLSYTLLLASSLSNSLRPHGLQPIRLLCPWDSPGKNSGVGCHFLLEEIFPIQGSTLGLLYCRWILYCPSRQKPQVALAVKNLLANTGRYKKCGFDSWIGKLPWRKAWQPTTVFLPGEFHGQKSLVGYSLWGCKETDMTEMTQHAPTNLEPGQARLVSHNSQRISSLISGSVSSLSSGTRGKKVIVK